MSTSVRVTFLLDSPTFGGAEHYLIQLLTHLPPRYLCTVVATEPVPAQLAAAAEDRARLVTIAPVGQRWRRVVAVVQTLRATRPDLMHVNLIDPRSNRVLLAAADAVSAPALATVHMTGTAGSGASRACLRRLYRRLDGVVAVSSEIADLVVGRLQTPADRVRVITVGVEPFEVRRHPPRARSVVGGLGRLTAQKGFDLLVQATRQLVREGQPVDVVIGGEGRDRDRLTAAAAGLPVRLLGFQHDVPAYLGSLDVFCLPSRAEGLPYALLEAMAAGLPCVAARVGEIPAAVDDAALLVAPDDVDALTGGLRRLLEDGALRAVLATRAAALVRRRHHVDRMVAATARLYDRLVPG